MRKVTAKDEGQEDASRRGQIEEEPETAVADRSLPRLRKGIEVTREERLRVGPREALQERVASSVSTQGLVDTALAARTHAVAAMDTRLEARRPAAGALVGKGFGLRDVAAVFCISDSRVQQLLDRR